MPGQRPVTLANLAEHLPGLRSGSCLTVNGAPMILAEEVAGAARDTLRGIGK
jgi:hypothetical protein